MRMLVRDEKVVMDEVNKFWSNFCAGNASVCLSKEVLLEGGYDLNYIKSYTRENAMAEEITLECENKREVVKLINEVFNGRGTHVEWKKRRVSLVHKEGCKKCVRNYRAIAIISIVRKVCIMMVKERMND